MAPNVIEEYLVKLGADIDAQSFNTAKAALGDLTKVLQKVPKAAAYLSLAAGIAAIGKAAVDTMQSVAKADMEYKKLGKDMWITANSAKQLKMAMDVMGESAEDIAWIPELRNQFFKLRTEMNRFSTPADAGQQLKFIRSINYEMQALFMRLKMMKEWVAYHLIKYLGPILKEVKGWIEWFSRKIGTDMPRIAKKSAAFMGRVVSVLYSAIKGIGLLLGKVYGLIESLPASVKRWGAIFSMVGAFILAGPFGKLLVALGAAMLLLEDFIYYLNGWKSSESLKPVWQALVDFGKGTGADILSGIKGGLTAIADVLDRIISGLNLPGVLRGAVKSFGILSKSISHILADLRKLFRLSEESMPKMKDGWKKIGEIMKWWLDLLLKGVENIGRVLELAHLIATGKTDEARELANSWKDEVVSGVKSVYSGATRAVRQFISPAAIPNVERKSDRVNIEGLTDTSKQGLAWLGKWMRENVNENAVISSAKDSTHNSPNSQHYKGTAVDLANWSLLTPESKGLREKLIKDAADVGLKVILELSKSGAAWTGPHIHIEDMDKYVGLFDAEAAWSGSQKGLGYQKSYYTAWRNGENVPQTINSRDFTQNLNIGSQTINVNVQGGDLTPEQYRAETQVAVIDAYRLAALRGGQVGTQ